MTLKKHKSKTSLQKLLKLHKINTTLPSIIQPKSSTKSCSVMYVALPNIHNDETCILKRPQLTPQNLPIQDRLAHAEAMPVSFLAEN